MLPAEKDEKTEQLINEYGNHILRLCYLYVKDYHLAEDLTQETFIKVYQNLGMFKGESSEKTWITRIAINLCKNVRKKTWFQKERGIVPENQEEAVEKDKFSEREDAMLVVAAIQQLSPKIREVMILYYYEEWSVKEIAEFLNVKENAILLRLKRGRDRLKMQLKEAFDFE